MIDLECPHCGRAGSLPREKANSRLVCKKCHTVFHMGPSGRALPGEPPAAKSAENRHPAPNKDVDIDFEWPKLGEMNRGLLGVLAVLLGLGTLYFGSSLFGGFGSGSLTQIARQMAEAVEKGDVPKIQSFAEAESRAEAAQWYESVKQTMETLKNRSSGHGVKVEPIVTSESVAGGTGQVEIFLVPVTGPARTDQIVREAAAAETKVSGVTTYWLYNGGRWHFDVKKTARTDAG